MASLLELIQAPFDKNWGPSAEATLTQVVTQRYGTKALKSIQVRVNGLTDEDAVPFAALIAAGQPTRGPYGGTSFVLFPSKDEKAPALVSLVVGTNGLAPDEQVLGRPGHARKAAAISQWLRQSAKSWASWAKHDPVRTDLSPPRSVLEMLKSYEPAVERYGNFLYLLYKPATSKDAASPQLTEQAAQVIMDLYAQDRGLALLADAERSREKLRVQWLSQVIPSKTSEELAELLKQRRFVILEGPPGTGKTRMARELLAKTYEGHGDTVQFHPAITYETFIGGLAPATANAQDIGLRFEPRPGYLMKAAAEAQESSRPYLLHIDEINRADLAKVLGEAIFLLEPGEPDRTVTLAHDFRVPFGRHFHLPPNLHILGTMNSADRSIAILDVAVRRRFAFVPHWPDIQVVQRMNNERMKEAFTRLFFIFLEEATDDTFALMPGHAYFLTHGGDTDATLRTGVKPLLLEYLAQGYVASFADQIRAYIDWLDTPSESA